MPGHIRSLRLVSGVCTSLLLFGVGCQGASGEQPTQRQDRSPATPADNTAPETATAKNEAPIRADRDEKVAAADPAPGEGSSAQQPNSATAKGDKASQYHPAMLDPGQADETAPDKYTAKLETTEGDIIIDVERAWAPLAADRFYNLVKIGYLKDVPFFRVVDGFMAQAGIHGDPEVNRVWGKANIKDEPVKQENTRGMVSFASAGKDTRSNQFFINFGDNKRLDPMGFAPFGKVRSMEVVDKLHSGYGEGPPYGRGPNQGKMQREGAGYLKAEFPELDYILSASIETP